jgi:hypothetical protein
MFPSSSQVEDLESEDDTIPADPPSTVKANGYHGPYPGTHTTPRTAALPFQTTVSMIEETHENSDRDKNKDAEDAEEYVVESIIEHYSNEEKKCYLDKWEGHEDCHDWLPEEGSKDATELMLEYNERVRSREGKPNMI